MRQGCPRPPPALMIHWEESQDPAYRPAHSLLWFATAKGYKAESAKEKRNGHSPEETSHEPRVLSKWSHRGYLNSSSIKLWQHMWSMSTMAAHQRLSTQTCDWSHPPPSTHQTSRVPEGKLVFNTRHIVCINSLRTRNHTYHLGTGGNPPEIQVPGCQPRANVARANLSKESSLRPALWALFCIIAHWSYPRGAPVNNSGSWSQAMT